MPGIRKVVNPQLRKLVEEAKKAHEQDPSKKVDEKIMDELVSIVADRQGVTREQAAEKLIGKTFDEKIAYAAEGLTHDEQRDLGTLAADPGFASILTSSSAQMMSALVGAKPIGEVPLAGRMDASIATRGGIRDEAAQALFDLVEKFKDVKGTGQESAAKGDPRVTERRAAVATLLADRGTDHRPRLEALGDKVKTDIEWLSQADRTEYTADGGVSMFNWAKSDMSRPRDVHTAFTARIKKGDERAKGVKDGSNKAFDVSDGSVAGIRLLEDTGVRQGALIDALLQFRARTDLANQTERNYGAASTRADAVAPGLIAEQRILLAEAELGDTPEQVREYALLREVVASHPTSSVNGIFEARNAVGKIYMDGNTSYSSKHHAMAWIKEDTAPGASAPAYKAIHHNFSRDTPVNIDATYRAWVFPTGPEERRGPLFAQLVAVQAEAGEGKLEDAKARLKDLAGVDRETIKPLLAKLDGVNDAKKFAKVVQLYLNETAKKPLAASPRGDVQAVQSFLENPKNTSSWSLSSAVKRLSGHADPAVKALGTEITGKPKDKQLEMIGKWLEQNPPGEPGETLPQTLDYFARLYRSTCSDQPGPRTLRAELFQAGPATAEITDVIERLEAGDDTGALKALGEARIAMRDAIVGSEKGFERHELIKFDAKLSRLTNTELGAAVDRVGELNTPAEKGEALVAIQSALRSAVASGLHELKDVSDPASTKGEPLDAVLKDLDAALDKGELPDDDGYRDLMSRVYVSVARTVQNTRAFVDSRAADVASLGAELDPEFLDQFVKQSPLHYATAISTKGLTVGLEEEIGPRMVKNVAGMRVLNSVGPVVFSNLVFAENTKELVKLKPPKDAMSILYGLEEKKMVAVGGLVVDTEDAPGGNSHLNMYAMNNGITVLALPELRTKYSELFENAKNEGGLYVTDEGGEVKMMTVDYAVETGEVKRAELDDLRPGTNRKITYLKSKGVGQGHEKVGYHEAIISPQRKTREVELFIAMDEVGGLGKECVSFDELATLGIHGRHLAGEKGTVLALLRSNPKLRDSVPDGSMVTTGRCRKLLDEAGIKDEWDAVWNNDPKVGTVDDDNFTQSAFYTDPDYRSEKRQELQDLTRNKLTDLLTDPPESTDLPQGMKLKTIKLMANEIARYDGEWPYEKAEYNPDGKSVKGDREFLDSMRDQFGMNLTEMRELVKKYAPTVTEAGKKLYNEIRDNPSMAKSDNWITRSSFTGEDRPGKSGAGQYESAFHLKDPVSRLEGVVLVMESTWMPEPIENNVADEVNLKHIMPACVVQHCLQPENSGVMISRDIEHGTRGQVYYQLVKGFGGGVEGGKTEEGTISASGHRVKVQYPGEPDGLVQADALAELRDIVLETERYFDEVVEKDKGYAVDMEVARQDGKWAVVQARVIQLDR